MNFLTLSLVWWIVGLLMWIFCDPKYPKAMKIGEWMFVCGSLAWLLTVGKFVL